jgi:DNA polymerase-3 subunit gamma/tau
MGQALYRKYRSKTLDEIIGQPHITRTLKKALESGRISHAYLFTGPRGVGKTSVARILAYEVNRLDSRSEALHLDIIEIDAASNRRIDEIRDLRERVHITPAGARYKVYIIDEVHMLTKEAFNALLKTLEEPPPHVIFILATTEAHKLPETIISRTQRFSFKPVSNEDLIKHLENIAKKEKINISEESLKLVAGHSDGSVRDGVGLLDQLSAAGKDIADETVLQMIGVPKHKSLKTLLSAIENGRGDKILSTLDELTEQGINPAIAAKELSAMLRSQLAEGEAKPWTTPLLRQLLNVTASINPQEDLEISLLEAASSAGAKLKVHSTEPKAANAPKTETISIKALPKKSATDQIFSLDVWPDVLTHIRKSGSGFYSALRLAKPTYGEGVLVLVFEFSLHQKKVNNQASRQQIASTIEALYGARPKIECVVDKSHFVHKHKGVNAKVSQKNEEKPSIEAISNIFGSAEVLES